MNVFMELIATTQDGKTISIGNTENVCAICGTEVPEGREICPSCQANTFS